MTDSLTVFGTDFTGVTGIKATGTGNGTLTYIRPQGTKSISANGTGIDVTEYAAVDVAVPATTPSLQSKSVSYTPQETAQSETVGYDSGYDGLSSVSVSVGAVSSTYVGTGITRRSSTDLTVSGSNVSVPAGYYASQANAGVASGTAGTPTATKGSVSNHAISVTPFVTNTTGYITGSTKSGTAITVSASELVSGSQTITENDDYDVTNLQSITVNVPTGGGSSWELIKSQTIEDCSTTSTSNATAATIALGSDAFTKNDIIWVHVRDVDGPRAGYFYGSDAIFVNANKANSSTSTFTAPGVTTIRYSTSSQYAAYTGAYGVWGYSITSGGSLTVRKRYNSNYSLTVNGDYQVDVYKLTPPSGMTLFE